jgi:nucleoside-diphosphate-sugar epimerase
MRSHCAAIVGVTNSLASPIGTFRVNVGGSLNVFEAMRLFGVKRVVNLSSEETYGVFESDRIDETHPNRPLKPYGISKYAVERLACDYSSSYGLECLHVRTCWVYGPFVDGTEAVRKGALDITRARTELDYEPRYPIKNGLAAYIEATRAGRG